MRRAFCALAVVALGAIGCSVDTELGVAAEIRSATVTVAGTGADAAASVMMDVQFRVGANALGPRTFQVPTADIRVDGSPLITINLDRPTGFDGTLSPGESQEVVLTGTSAAPDADSTLCSATSAIVVIRWEHRDATDPESLPEIDVTELETSNITCM